MVSKLYSIHRQFKSTLDFKVPRTYPPIETLQIMWWLFFTDYSLESVPQSYKYYLLELETDHVSQSVFEMCAVRHIALKQV